MPKLWRNLVIEVSAGFGSFGISEWFCETSFGSFAMSFCRNCLVSASNLTDVWRMFQEMFEEGGFKIYESHKTIIEFILMEQQKKAENWRLTVAELTERVHDKYWRVEEMGDAMRIETFISMLETSLNLIISQFA